MRGRKLTSSESRGVGLGVGVGGGAGGEKMGKVLLLIAFLGLIQVLLPTLNASQQGNNRNLTAASSVWLAPIGAELNGPPVSRVNISEKLLDVLHRRGPNIRASADYHDFKDIRLEESIEAWHMMRKQAGLFAIEQVQFYKLKMMSMLRMANVSESCEMAVNITFDAMRNLEAWSIKMWSSTGNFPPAGLFDGQVTDLGSYYGCLETQRSSPIEHTSYCMLAFRPVIPSRPKNHMVFNQVPEPLLSTFSHTDIFHDFLKQAQYFHYFYLKMGVCVPHQCSPEDVQRVAGLLGSQKFYMMNGPVKCYTRAPVDQSNAIERYETKQIEFGKIEDEPVLVELAKPLNKIQRTSLIIVLFFYLIVFIASLWHGVEMVASSLLVQPRTGSTADQQFNEQNKQTIMFKGEKRMEVELAVVREVEESRIKRIAFEYFSVITNAREFLNCDSVKSATEIKCLHGIRVFTMIWVISVHNLQYNQWDGFTRIYENVKVLQNIVLHPVYNASYVVDNFFFMSGLLASYTVLLNKNNPGEPRRPVDFNLLTSLLARYLRLTPQVLLISLCYILLPLVGEGPFWYDMTHYAAKYCEKNWWVNLLHLQAFYREDEICNLVGWWISVDMFYYVVAVFLLYMIIRNKNLDYSEALLSSLLLTVVFHAKTAYKHYTNGYTPNNLGTVPQIGENWTGFVVDFFWSPEAHVVPFYLGFWCGYLLAFNGLQAQVRKYQHAGWLVSTLTLLVVNFGTHIWMSGYLELNNQFVSTLYNGLCPIAWALSFAWIVVSLHYNCGPEWINKLLSTKLLVLISKASFIIYLSHMLLIRYYFGSQVSLIEVSPTTLIYVITGNSVISILLGLFLAITFEGPCMKFQKFAIGRVKAAWRSTSNKKQNNNNHVFDNSDLREVAKELLKS